MFLCFSIASYYSFAITKPMNNLEFTLIVDICFVEAQADLATPSKSAARDPTLCTKETVGLSALPTFL